MGANVHVDTNSSDSDLAQSVCYIWQMIMSFVISCINTQYQIVTVIHEYWPFLLIKTGAHIYVVHDTLCYMHNYYKVKIEFWGWVMLIFSNFLGWVTNICAITRGWVMFFLRNWVFISSGPPPCTFWPAPYQWKMQWTSSTATRRNQSVCRYHCSALIAILCLAETLQASWKRPGTLLTQCVALLPHFSALCQ